MLFQKVEEIGSYAFSSCYFLEKVVLPDSLKYIDVKAFVQCSSLKDVTFPSNLEGIGDFAFEVCSDLKSVNLPKNLKWIGNNAFRDCFELEEVIIQEGIEELNQTFYGCRSLSKVVLPKSLKKIGNDTFSGCKSLKNVEFDEGLEIIGKRSFYSCIELKKVELPKTLKVIGDSAFFDAGLITIDIPDSVEKIGNIAFSVNENLEEVTLGKGLKRVGESCFSHCKNLKRVDFKGHTKEIGKETFSYCEGLESVHLPIGLKKIEKRLFFDCNKLKEIEIPEGVKEIKEDAFYSCEDLEVIKFPSTLDVFNSTSISYSSNLERIILNDNGKEKEIKINSLMFIRDKTEKLFVYDCFSRKTLGFYNEGKYITFDESIITENNAIKTMLEERQVTSDNFVSLYYWLNKKFIPSHIIIKSMPLNDIDNFFINKNYCVWGNLLKECDFEHDMNKASFFKLCYVLGVFSKSTSIRDRAVEFLKENIIGKRTEYWIHSRCDGFDLNNGFNEEYAEFFMKYYSGKNFMRIQTDLFGTELDLLAASYNNFKQVKKVYPNKTLHTNREADLLLPEHVIDAIRTTEYEDVDEDNEEFAKVVGKYGYTQDQFKRLQGWYNEGKNKIGINLYVGEDEETKGITYKLLSKEDPLNAVLGNITNCCQIVDGAGEDCVEYGMTMPNSGFITFNYRDKIIGQSWVWYDEESNTVCLDNIEVPHNYLEKINQNKTIQKSFIDCLLRIEESFKKEMNKRGLKVDKVTIGKGCNDLERILDLNFELLKYHNFLSGYGGYTDASSQYEIKRVKKNNRI